MFKTAQLKPDWTVQQVWRIASISTYFFILIRCMIQEFCMAKLTHSTTTVVVVVASPAKRPLSKSSPFALTTSSPVSPLSKHKVAYNKWCVLSIGKTDKAEFFSNAFNVSDVGRFIAPLTKVTCVKSKRLTVKARQVVRNLTDSRIRSLGRDWVNHHDFEIALIELFAAVDRMVPREWQTTFIDNCDDHMFLISKSCVSKAYIAEQKTGKICEVNESWEIAWRRMPLVVNLTSAIFSIKTRLGPVYQSPTFWYR